MPYCKVCGNKAYSEYCFKHKPQKAIEQRGKGSHPGLRYELTNMQYLCRPCHRAKTDRRVCMHHDII